MLKSLKRLTRHSAVYGVGHIITRLVNFLLLPLYTNVLSTEDFGATQIVYTFIAVMTILYTFGIDAAFLRYYILCEDKRRQKTLFSVAFWTVAVAVLCFTSAILIFAKPIDAFLITKGDYNHFFKYAAFILGFDALTALPFLLLRALEKSMLYTALKFVNVIINVCLNVYLIVYQQMGAEGMLIANLWASGTTFLLTGFLWLKQLSFTFDFNELKTMIKFGLPFLPATLSVVILDLIDRPIIERLAGLEATGIYSANAKLGMFMALLVTAFRFAWHPFFLSTAKQEGAKAIFSKVLTYVTLLNAAIFLLLCLFIADIVQISIGGFTLLGKSYWSGLNVAPPILLSYLFYGMYVNFMVGVYLKEKTKYLPLITLSGMFVNIIVNLIAIPKIGILGAAWARLSGHLVMCVMLYFFAQRFYPIRYEFGRLAKLAGIIGAILFAQHALNAEMLASKVALFLLLPLSLTLVGFFEERELNVIKKFILPSGKGRKSG